MASQQPQGDGLIVGINVTPMVDVMLVLLIIFIVTAKIIVTPAVPMDLPEASQVEQVQVVLSVLVEAQQPERLARRDAGPCLLRGLQPASVVAPGEIALVHSGAVKMSTVPSTLVPAMVLPLAETVQQAKASACTRSTISS